MSSHKQSSSLSPRAVIVIALVFPLLVTSLVWGLVLLNSYIAQQWPTFTSNRVPLTFRYPPHWPVAQCSDTLTFQFENMVEQLDFDTSCVPNAHSSRFGTVTAYNMGPITNPSEYIKDYKTRNGFQSINVSTTKLGVNEVYYVTHNPDAEAGGVFAPIINEYFLFHNNQVYIFRLINPGHLDTDPEEGKRLFTRVVESVRFK